ncbi:ras-related protein Rab-43-like [Sycon ciliatum]|uniref:ras-related protein Rab-43-like n=1 Tax=Sycon ciliatum TaxID=27933 RepID=UPI0020ADC405|eukprot:scpid65246/ scgid12360/ Ras-related protein Rab-43; Ras-related protein Rab-41
MADGESYDFLFKIVVIGDSMVGKTSLLQRFKNGAFNEHHSCTIGVDFIVKTVEMEGKVVKLHIWDTAGQERFKSVSHSFYHNAHAAILVYDITNEGSFFTTARWLADVRRFSSPKTLCMLVGNKLDAGNQRMVSKETALQFANDNKVTSVVEASAKDNSGVEMIFHTLTKDLLSVHSTGHMNGMRVEDLGQSDSECDSGGEDVIHYRKRHIVPVVINLNDEPKQRNCQC